MITCVGKVTFNPNALLVPMRAEGRARVVKAAYHLKGKLQAKVGRPGNVKNKRAVRRDGEIRSKPGEPPMKQTGFGQRNITIKWGEGQLSAQIGIFENAIYMVYLEFGTDDGHIKERPWLRPTFADERGTIFGILNGSGRL
ncbi:MAG: hypothetical protein KF805_12465 [Phycisphaeraceae bacterium]|nr:hypothetical protein [Phycisphaeraceae bacterium]